MASRRAALTLRTADPASAAAEEVLRAYMNEVVARYWRRPASADEVERAMREHPSGDLKLATGRLVLASLEDVAVGCGGVRFLAEDVAELTRVWVAPAARRRGFGSRIVRELERYAAERGRTRIRLDTRSDLTEARALYARLGYREAAPFNDAPYAEHWLEKILVIR